MRHLINILDFSTEELQDLIDTANDIIANPEKYSQVCRGRKLATLFFEPSTRTRLSFEAAMYELGGNVIGFSAAQNSSAAKGESVADTAKTISCYADIIAMRHPKEPHPDPGGPADHLPGKGPLRPSDRGPLRRFEVRPHGPLPHQRSEPL